MNSVYNDIYKKIYGDKLFESIVDSSSGNTEVILKQGTYPMYVDALRKVVDVDLKVIVNAVNSALGNLAAEYDFMYQYIKWSRPMYVLGDPRDKRVIHKTGYGMYFYATPFLYREFHLHPLNTDMGEEFPDIADNLLA